MAEKRVIEYEAASELANDDWLLIDGVTEGTRKARPSTVTAELGAQVTNLASTVGDLTQVAMGHEQSFAPDYDESASYDVGDLVMQYHGLYKCTAATTGTWDAGKWARTEVSEQLEESGKIDDVQVNGVSVVTDKVASIDLTDMQADIDSKQADTKIGGASILDNNKVANLDFLASYGEASGSIASFNDGAAMPLKSLKVGIEAVQSGSGDPSPTNVRPFTGWSAVNVYDTSDNLGDCADIPEPLTTNTWYRVNLPVETYTISFDVSNAVRTAFGDTFVFAVYDGTTNTNILASKLYSVEDDSTYQSKGANVSGRFYFTYTGKFQSIACYWRSNTYQSLSSGSLENIMIEKGANPTKQFKPYNGTTTPIQFVVNGETKTIYSGYVEIKNGKVKAVATTGYVDLGTVSWSKSSVGGKTYFVTKNEIADAKKSSGINYIQGISCSNYKEDTWAHVLNTPGYDGYICIGWANKSYIAVNDTRYNDSTANEFKEALDGVQLVYKLATPIEYDLADISISTQDGTNNLWADSGDILECKYVRDNSAVINDLIARVTALENA